MNDDEYAEARKAAASDSRGRIDFNPDWLKPKGIEPYPKDEYPQDHKDEDDLLILYAADVAVVVGCCVGIVAMFMGWLT